MTDIYLPDGTIPMPKSGGTFTDSVNLGDNYLLWNNTSNLSIVGVPGTGNMYLTAAISSGDDIIMIPDDRVSINGALNITGALSKGSGSCLTTDIFYNNSLIQIKRGMVCVATGETIGDRVFSKPITSTKPCDTENDSCVLGVKVFEDIAHSTMIKSKAIDFKKYIVPSNPAPRPDMLLDNSTNHAYSKMQNELDDLEYELYKQLSISGTGDKFHIGILGQYSSVLVDAEIEPIKTGDLLTTSETIGHGMKSVDKELGTIFGKALENKNSGKGYLRTMLLQM